MSLFRTIALAAGIAVLVPASAPAVRAGNGVGELSLDREAVRGLLEAALPPPAVISLPGLPELVVRVERPRRVELVDGGVEAVIGIVIEGAAYRGALRVRYVPEVTRPEGIVTLRPESAIPDTPLPVTLDLAALLPAVTLPRALSFAIDGPSGLPLELTCLVQGIEVRDERVVVQFGLLSRQLPLFEPASSP